MSVTNYCSEGWTLETDAKKVSLNHSLFINDSNQQFLFEKIMSSTSDIIGVTSFDNNIIYVSPSVERILGYTVEELLGKKGSYYAHPDDLPTIENAAQKLMETGETIFEWRAKHKDGYYIWLENNMQLVTNIQTGERFMIFVSRDINQRKIAEIQLKQSEKKLRQYFDSPLIGIGEIDTTGRWLIVNDRLCEMLGYSREELLKMTWMDLTPKDRLESDLALFNDALYGDFSCHILDKEYIRKDGRIINATLTSMSITNSEGEIIGFVNTVSDISEQMTNLIKIKELHRQLNELLQHIPLVVFRIAFIDEWNVIYVNEECYRLSGYTAEEFIQKKIKLMDIVYEEDKEEILKLAHSDLQNKERSEYTFRIKSKTGEIKWIMCKLYNFNSINNILHIDGIISDITQIKNYELQLMKTTNELTQINNMKDKFFSIIAHDMRSPLQAIITMADFLIGDINNLSQEESFDCLGHINRAARELYNLLDNLLEWARCQTGMIEYHIELIKLMDFVTDCMRLLYPNAKAKKQTINVLVDQNLYIRTDYKMLCLVLRNLVSNAIKYTPQYGKILVEAFTNGENVVIKVSDNGIGMTREQRENCFRIDYRRTSLGTNNETGSGMGLLLCDEFVKYLKGRITIDSKQGIGTTFAIELPKVLLP